MAPTVLLAGQKVRASVLSDSLPRVAMVLNDVSKTSSTAFGDITGLALALAANSAYALDGYIAYNSNETADLKLAWTIPASVTGHWIAWGLVVGSTGGSGALNAQRNDAYGDANPISLGGSNFAGNTNLACQPRGYILTGATPGTFQARFAQNTSNGTATTIKAGSWIRLAKIA